MPQHNLLHLPRSSVPWNSLPDLPTLVNNTSGNESPIDTFSMSPTLVDRRSSGLTYSGHSLNVLSLSPVLHRRSAPNVHSHRSYRVADTQLNPLDMPMHALPLPIHAQQQSLSVPSSPLTSRSDLGVLHQQQQIAFLGQSAGLMPEFSDAFLLPGLLGSTPPRERSRSSPVMSPTRRNTQDRHDQRRLSDKIAEQKRRQAEHEAAMAEALSIREDPPHMSMVMQPPPLSQQLSAPQQNMTLDFSLELSQLALSLKDTGLQLDPTDPLQDTGLQLSSDPNHLTAPKLQQLGPLALSVEDVEAILNDTELQS